jgi:ubiquinone/menaquinone biosynthesis C-methylase UbiE
MGDNSAWDAYWDQPRLAACLRDEQGNYSGVIAARWAVFFSDLKKQSNILDIATGNGAVALMALECSDRLGLGFSIHGIDSANIDPAASIPELRLQLERIDFLGNVKSEALPYDDNSFDAVSGQYALEYSRLDRSLSEISRVIRPGGELMFITHTDDSGVCATTRAQLDDVAGLTPLALIPQVIELVNAEKSPSSHDMTNIQTQFNQNAARAMQRLQNSSGQSRKFIGQYLQQMGEIYQVREKWGPDETIKRLEQLDVDFKMHEARLRDLANAAMSAEDIDSCISNMLGLGFEIVESVAVISTETGGKLGHCVRAIMKR